MTKIPLTCPDIGMEEARVVAEVVRSGQLEQGCRVEALEQQFAEFTGARYAVAVNTGTAALQLALIAHGIGKGDPVYTPALSEPAILDAICATGAIPVLVDVDPYTYTVSPMALEAVLRSLDSHAFICHSGAGAVLAVHLFGQPCDMTPMQQLADAHGVTVIEVAWDAPGAAYHGTPVGSTGTATFSFQRGRGINSGEGGMLTTDSESVALKAGKLRNYGCDNWGRMDEVGFNYRMTDITAALAASQLDRVSKHVEIQVAAAMSYTQALYDVEGIVPPSVLPGTLHAFQRYGIRLTEGFPLNPSGARRYLGGRDIETRTGANLMVPPIARAACANGRDRFPEAERISSELLFLPMHAHLKTEEIATIVHAVRAAGWDDAMGA